MNPHPFHRDQAAGEGCAEPGCGLEPGAPEHFMPTGLMNAPDGTAVFVAAEPDPDGTADHAAWRDRFYGERLGTWPAPERPRPSSASIAADAVVELERVRADLAEARETARKAIAYGKRLEDERGRYRDALQKIGRHAPAGSQTQRIVLRALGGDGS